jgi:hypothetical protein
MKKNRIIDLFEEILPKDLVPKLSENESQFSKDAFEETREFLLKEASTEYFNLFIRKVLAKQIEMREDVNDGKPFHSDWIYSKNVMDKYMSCLDENDELRVRYQKSDLGDWLGDIKDFGII